MVPFSLENELVVADDGSIASPDDYEIDEKYEMVSVCVWVWVCVGVCAYDCIRSLMI